MLFNTDKCKIIHIGHSNCHADYYMSGNKLEIVDEEKDLGVIVSKDLKWDKQCSQAVKKANRMLGVIKRNFTDRSKETIMPLYKSLVRPHLEYCVPIWSPHYQKDIELVEGVQRRATKLIDEVRNLHYEERIKQEI